MKTTTEDTAELVKTQSQLEAAIELALKQSRVAVDLESNGFYRYPERVCLVQLAVGPSVYLIDPLALEDPSPLGELLADAAVEKVFHSADYDIRSLDRDWGFPVRGLFDTSIAAAFVGAERLGLAAVLKEYLDVEVNKSKRLQRADWTRRPISDELLRYAAEDVRHLARLRTLLYDRLDSLGRTEWVRGGPAARPRTRSGASFRSRAAESWTSAGWRCCGRYTASGRARRFGATGLHSRSSPMPWWWPWRLVRAQTSRRSRALEATDAAPAHRECAGPYEKGSGRLRSDARGGARRAECGSARRSGRRPGGDCGSSRSGVSSRPAAWGSTRGSSGPP